MKWRWLAVVASILILGFVTLKVVGKDSSASWVEAELGDLILTIPTEGRLQAVESTALGPPQITDQWDFKISNLASDGQEVKAGDLVLAFDSTQLQQKLQDKMSEASRARKEIEKLKTTLGLERSADELKLATAEANYRKHKLKTEVPEELETEQLLQFARMDLSLAEAEIKHLKERISKKDQSTQAALAQYESQARSAEASVEELMQSIERMEIKAPRSGTVVLTKDWRDETLKVGDSTWRDRKVLEIPDMNTMQGLAEVDEADAGSLRNNQKVRIRLDAHPDIEFTGTVQKVHRTVQRKSWRTPIKIWKLTVALDETDPEKMRPGMRFRGEIETAKLENKVLIPLTAVVPSQEGPYVLKETTLGTKQQFVSLGERNQETVEVLDGLKAGDRILANPTAERAS